MRSRMRGATTIRFAGVLVLMSLAVTVRAADVSVGQALYASRCAFCHGPSGKGDGPAGAALKPAPTDFTNADFWKTTGVETMRAAVENGKPNTAMVAFKATLSPEQIAALLGYLQTFRPSP